MTEPMIEMDGGGVELEDPAVTEKEQKDNSPRLDAPPEESSDASDDKANKENVGASAPDVDPE